jgi:hypothetical protein
LIREYAKTVVENVFSKKNNSCSFIYFLDCIYGLNQLIVHPKSSGGIKYGHFSSDNLSQPTLLSSSSPSDSSNIHLTSLSALSGPLNAQKRYVIYSFLLSRMSDEQKFNLIGRFHLIFFNICNKY